jgi:hypothetical protein
MEERDRKLTDLDAAIERGLADARAARVHDLDEVCEKLDAELAALPDRPAVQRVLLSAEARGDNDDANVPD